MSTTTALLLVVALAVASCRPSIESSARRLQHDDPAVRVAGVTELAHAGPAAAAAVPLLQRALSDPVLVDVALWALSEIGPASGPAVPELLRIPVAGVPLREMVVCIALGKAGVRNADVTSYLTARVASPDPMVRLAARGAVQALRQ